ncbi:MAG: elongation factor G [Candidatus Omnitrophota bacterium]|nr:elongation factor G [Candidatus Omnitrophota bacterium]
MVALQKRVFFLVGHAQSGKTSLAESLLFVSGTTSRKGTIAEGNTLSDYSPDEIERKISISSSILIAQYQGCQLQIIDTPGYADFIGEVISSIRAVDAAILVIDAISGIEVGTESVFNMLEDLNLPRIFFVNKMDKEGADFNKLVLEIKDNLSPKAVVLDSLNSPQLIEAVAETDDKLLEKYLETGSLSEEEVISALRQAVIQAKIFPIISGSSATDKGIKELLDAIVKYLPNPVERTQLKGLNPNSKEEKEIVPSEDGAFCAFVFKTIADPYVGQLTLFRIFRGRLISNTSLFNVNKSAKERIGQVYVLQGKEQRSVNEAVCGDIVALSKLKDTTTNDTLADEKDPVEFAPIIFPEPAISSSVKPKSRQDEEKISTSLNKLSCEDPTFKTTRDQETKELIISGIGDLHLNVMVERLKRRFNVEVELDTPKVSYKETITKSAKAQGKYKKQSGGRGQYGDVWIEIEPLPKGSGDFEFVDKIFGGAIPRNYIPSVEKGVRQAMQNGILAGYPLVGFKVILFDGSFHQVDSSDIAFQIAGRMALRKAELEAGPVLLEPIMDVDVVVSDEFMGHISGDLNSRRGRIMGMDTKGKLQVVKAQVPLVEMFTYATDLRSFTGGRASYSMKFSHLEQVPTKIAQTIIAKVQATKKLGEEE